MNRRNFIYSSSILSTAAVVGSKSTVENLISGPESESFYLARSGNYKKDNFYLLGVFRVANPESITQQIDRIKKEHNYRTKISYNCNDKFKTPVAKALIKLFLEQDIFATILFETSLGPANSKSRSQLKFDAIQKIVGKNFNSNLIAKNESYFGPSTQMKESFSSKIGGQFYAERTEQSLILQLADLINGCIYGAIHNKVTNPTKLEIVDYFKRETGIDTFVKGTGLTNKFNII